MSGADIDRILSSLDSSDAANAEHPEGVEDDEVIPPAGHPTLFGGVADDAPAGTDPEPVITQQDHSEAAASASQEDDVTDDRQDMPTVVEGWEDEPVGSPAPVEASADEPGEPAAPAASPTRARGAGRIFRSPRRTFLAIAALLALLLLGLIGFLIYLAMSNGYTQKGGAEQAGIVPLLQIYGPGTGTTPKFNKPMGAAFGPDGRIYVADTQNNRIAVFSKSGRFLFEFGGFGIAKPLAGSTMTWKPGLLSYPTDVAVDKNGDVYVADFYNDSISVFNKKGRFLRRFPDPYKPVGEGSSGQDGGGIRVTSVTVVDGKVYATDEYQVFVFDTSGKLLRQFGKPGAGPGDLDHPNGLAVDSSGRVFVSDSNHNRVTAFSPEGTVLWVTGTKVSEVMKTTDNPFILPRGLCLTLDGSIIVADPLGQTLVKLDRDGKVVGHFGMRGDQPGQLNFPNDADARKDTVLITDKENNRVQVVRLIAK